MCFEQGSPHWVMVKRGREDLTKTNSIFNELSRISEVKRSCFPHFPTNTLELSNKPQADNDWSIMTYTTSVCFVQLYGMAPRSCLTDITLCRSCYRALLSY